MKPDVVATSSHSGVMAEFINVGRGNNERLEDHIITMRSILDQLWGPNPMSTEANQPEEIPSLLSQLETEQDKTKSLLMQLEEEVQRLKGLV